MVLKELNNIDFCSTSVAKKCKKGRYIFVKIIVLLNQHINIVPVPLFPIRQTITWSLTVQSALFFSNVNFVYIGELVTLNLIIFFLDGNKHCAQSNCKHVICIIT